ncbi:MAG: hypothetical protein RMH74_05190 [Candidatus Caldarchaeum sp.]|nr:hypothetical protein [Candidatus Caldarchaeum sp.]
MGNSVERVEMRIMRFQKSVASRKQLEEAVEKPAVRRMHRPWIDMYVFRCGQCGGMMKRHFPSSLTLGLTQALPSSQASTP